MKREVNSKCFKISKQHETSLFKFLLITVVVVVVVLVVVVVVVVIVVVVVVGVAVVVVVVVCYQKPCNMRVTERSCYFS